MTWYKHGTEFVPECAEAGLSDAAFRTHVEAMSHIYQVESKTLEIREDLVRTLARSSNWYAAVTELVDKRFWRKTAKGYKINHHAAVIRDSIQAQQKQRKRNRQAQAAKRAREKAGQSVSADVSADPEQNRTEQPKGNGSYKQKGGHSVNQHDAAFFSH